MYGPHIIIEYLQELLFTDAATSSASLPLESSLSNASYMLLPTSPNERAMVRRWFGWCRTAYFYQLEPLFWENVAPVAFLSRNIDAAGVRGKLTETGVQEFDQLPLLDTIKKINKGKRGECNHDEQRHLDGLRAELSMRVESLEKELAHRHVERSSSSSNSSKATRTGIEYALCGESHSYADYFVLCFLFAAEAFLGGDNGDAYPNIRRWRDEVLSVSEPCVSTLANLLKKELQSVSALY